MSIFVGVFLVLGVFVWAWGCILLLWATKSGDEKSGLALRVALMCPLIMACWLVTYDISFRRVHLISFYLMFGPITAGFYAGASKRTYRYALYACLATAAMVVVCWSGVLYLFLDKSLEDVREIAITVLPFILLFEAIGAVPALAIPLVWARVVKHRT